MRLVNSRGLFVSNPILTSQVNFLNAYALGTRGHASLSKIVAYRYALDPRVSNVTLDLGYKRLLGGGNFRYGPRPDVGVLYKSGKVRIIEIASKTDNVHALRMRNANFMKRNGIQGNVRVYTGAQKINSVWSK